MKLLCVLSVSMTGGPRLSSGLTERCPAPPGRPPSLAGGLGVPDRNLAGGHVWGVPLRRVFWVRTPIGPWGGRLEGAGGDALRASSTTQCKRTVLFVCSVRADKRLNTTTHTNRAEGISNCPTKLLRPPDQNHPPTALHKWTELGRLVRFLPNLAQVWAGFGEVRGQVSYPWPARQHAQ